MESEADRIEKLVMDHYRYKYIGDVALQTSNGRYRINGNIINFTVIFVLWDYQSQPLMPSEITETIDVNVNMDTGYCTDDRGESTYLW